MPEFPPKPRLRDDIDPRLAELKRMRLIATSLLGLMTGLFLLTSLLQRGWPWLAYLRAFAEAGMVGACADWFAVVALFRRPFGLAIPHTGIIPHNKERIGNALGRFVANNFLSPKILARKLNRIDFAIEIGRWLDKLENRAMLGNQLATLLPQILSALPKDQLSEVLATSAKRGLAGLPAAPFASRALAILWANGGAQLLLDRGLEIIEASIIQNKDFIAARIAEKTYRFVPKWVDGLLADRVLNGLRSTIAEMRQPQHPWRDEVRGKIEKLIQDLAKDQRLRRRAEAMKKDLLESSRFNEQVLNLSGQVSRYVIEDAAQRQALVTQGLDYALETLGRGLREDESLKPKVNRYTRRAVLRIIAPRRADIGAFISHIVANWDSTTLVDKLELQVGKDLQYVRINGTLVGGLVGLVIFTVSRWFLPG
jgi:uncharacterized membrane-anchored protein YjiN (DUF445 family)